MDDAAERSDFLSRILQFPKHLVLRSYEEFGNLEVAIAVLLGVLLILYAVVHSLLKSFTLKKKRRLVLMLGQSGSGKTAMLLRMQYGTLCETVSSLVPNSVKINILGENSEPIEFVDYPGHKQLQHGVADYIPSAECILYLIDSTNKAEIKLSADYVRQLLANKDLVEKQIPMLMVCSKSDNRDARAPSIIKEQLEREIEKSRLSDAALEDEEEFTQFSNTNGTFQFDAAPYIVQFCEASSKSGDLSKVFNFLEDVLKQK